MKKPKVLVLEDEPVTRSRIAAHLRAEGFDVSEAGTLADGRTLMAHVPFDVVILDINLPDGSGFALTRELRERSEVGIVLVTQRQDDTDRVVGLELGADDYVTKPFNLRELVVRVRNLSRRVASLRAVEKSSSGQHAFAGWVLDEEARLLHSPEGEVVRLTRGEFDILSVLASNAGRVMSRDRILDLIERDGEEPASDRTIDVLIGRLRKKIEPDPKSPTIIVTVHGVGYRLVGA